MEAILTALVGVIGTLCGAALQWFLSNYLSKAKLVVDSVEIHHFRSSVRVLVVVRNKGRGGTRAIGYLTITTKIGSENINGIPASIVVEKKGTFCTASCCQCRGKYYLAPTDGSGDRIIIQGEALPCTLPLDSGKGLDGIPYKHMGYLPQGGALRFPVLDIYKYKDRKDKGYYLVKVHSEYGTEHYPRICMILPLGERIIDEIVFTVTISGENSRNEVQTKIIIKYSNNIGDYTLISNNRETPLKTLLNQKDSIKYETPCYEAI